MPRSWFAPFVEWLLARIFSDGAATATADESGTVALSPEVHDVILPVDDDILVEEFGGS